MNWHQIQPSRPKLKAMTKLNPNQYYKHLRITYTWPKLSVQEDFTSWASWYFSAFSSAHSFPRYIRWWPTSISPTILWQPLAQYLCFSTVYCMYQSSMWLKKYLRNRKNGSLIGSDFLCHFWNDISDLDKSFHFKFNIDVHND